jgi:CBS domain-containing protein
MKVDSILTVKGSDVETIASDAPLMRAAQRMSALHVGALVISHDGKHLEGLVSERDIVYGIARRGRSILDIPVRDVMHSDPPVCRPDDSLRDVMAKMTRLRVRHLPVIDHGTLCGLVSIGDVVKNRLEEAEHELMLVRHAYIGRG